MSFLRAASSSAGKRASTSATAITPSLLYSTSKALFPHIINNSSTLTGKRTYADKKTGQPQSSILNDDLLAKAGFDADQIDENVKAAKSNGEPSSSSSPSPEDGSEKTNNTTEQASQQKRRKRSKKTSGDLKRERWANIFYVVLFGFSAAGAAYMVRPWDEGENQYLEPGEEPIGDGYSPQLMYQRFNKRWKSLFTVFSEPGTEKLLPDSPPEPYKRPLTLVISLEDLLTHSEWTPQHGWRTAKRPGLDYFLLYLSGYYEIVLFASNYLIYVEKTIQKLDPHNAYFAYVLCKEAAKYKNKKVIKDLSLLNRDLGKVIIMDTNPDHYSLQPENALPLDPWDGKPDDTLIQYIPFLEWLAFQPNLKDVRPVLDTYKDRKKIPEEFAAREAKLKEQLLKDYEEQNKSLNANNWAAKLLGLPVQRQEPKLPNDLYREQGQMQYQKIKEYIEQHVAAEEAKNKELLANQKLTLNSLIKDGVNPQELIMQQQAQQAEAEANGAAAAASAAQK